MIRTRAARAALLALAPAVLAGCAAISSLDSASRTLEAYELSAPAGEVAGTRTARTLLVELPTASGGLGTDRIMVKPNPIQVQYLSGARWIEPAPALVQALLVRSIANTGRVGFVSGQASGPIPDFVLLTDLQAFQAEVPPGGQPPVVVVTRIALTLLRDIDQRVVATRVLEQRVPAASADPSDVVRAFDTAMHALLTEATRWSIDVTASGGV